MRRASRRRILSRRKIVKKGGSRRRKQILSRRRRLKKGGSRRRLKKGGIKSFEFYKSWQVNLLKEDYGFTDDDIVVMQKYGIPFSNLIEEIEERQANNTYDKNEYVEEKKHMQSDDPGESDEEADEETDED